MRIGYNDFILTGTLLVLLVERSIRRGLPFSKLVDVSYMSAVHSESETNLLTDHVVTGWTGEVETPHGPGNIVLSLGARRD